MLPEIGALSLPLITPKRPPWHPTRFARKIPLRWPARRPYMVLPRSVPAHVSSLPIPSLLGHREGRIRLRPAARRATEGRGSSHGIDRAILEKAKGSIFEIVYRRLTPRLGHNQASGAIAHRLCRLIWMILHQGVHYEERGPAVSERSRRKRTLRMIRVLRSFGYQVEPVGNAACT